MLTSKAHPRPHSCLFEAKDKQLQYTVIASFLPVEARDKYA